MTEKYVRILSWNVDTPLPFLDLTKAALVANQQTTLAQHFQTRRPPNARTAEEKKRKRQVSTPPREGEETLFEELARKKQSLPESSQNGGTPIGTKVNALAALVKKYDWPDIVCLQEIRARAEDKDWIEALRQAIHDNGESDEEPTFKYKAHFCLNQKGAGGGGKRKVSQRHFGVVTYIRTCSPLFRDLASVRTVDWDDEGRVLILDFHSGWSFYNVYALNGSEHPYLHPKQAHSPPMTRNERKREFNHLLMKEVQRQRAKDENHRVVLIGDFNISLTKDDCLPRLRTEFPHNVARQQMNEVIMPGMKVVDVFRYRHGQACKQFSWFARTSPQTYDCARVDYALVDAAWAPHVQHIQYLQEPVDRAHSDHGPLLLDLPMHLVTQS